MSAPISLADAIRRMHEIPEGDDDVGAHEILAAIAGAAPEEIGRAVLLVARDLLAERRRRIEAELEAVHCVLAATRAS